MTISTTVSYAQAACDAWSRGFNYENYVLWCNKIGAHVMPEVSYKMMCQAFEIDMEHSQPAAINLADDLSLNGGSVYTDAHGNPY